MIHTQNYGHFFQITRTYKEKNIYYLMIIENIPEIFQPIYKSTYPEYSEGQNIEEIFHQLFLKVFTTIDTEYIYLPIYWTSYYVINNYGANISPLLKYIKTLDKTKKYFTIVQYASGIYVENQIDNILVFSAGGGGLNKKEECVREEIFFNLKRHIFYGNTSQYAIPLICYPIFPVDILVRQIYCSFMGRYDTHRCRIKMKNELNNHDNFLFFDSIGFQEYKNLLNTSVFTLAPRGYGYTSFRIYEAILAGSIPIYIWQNKKVLPFEDILHWEEFSIIIEENEIKNLPEIMKKCDIQKMQKKIQEVRQYFNFDYTFKYIKSKI